MRASGVERRKASRFVGGEKKSDQGPATSHANLRLDAL